MKTERQKELINSFLSALEDEFKPLYQDIIVYLSELGYNPQKEKSNISFKHDLHNKQIVKMGVKKSKEPYPFFSLRFSACKDYSQRFSDIVSSAIIKYPSKAPGCISNGCHYCMGEPETHIYTYTFPNGERKLHCGAHVFEIPSITVKDMGEIKKLIKEEHEYLLKHEASIK